MWLGVALLGLGPAFHGVLEVLICLDVGYRADTCARLYISAGTIDLRGSRGLAPTVTAAEKQVTDG